MVFNIDWDLYEYLLTIPWPGTNFIHESRSEEDKDTCFGPVHRKEKFIVFDDSWTMADILTEAGLMPSRTQARKQGKDGPIPHGFTHGREKPKYQHKNFWILR